MSLKNPRSFVLMASRHRSGSVDDTLDSPPTSPPPPVPDEPEAEVPNFPPMYKADSLTRVNKPGHVGSKVSRMKEIFQQQTATNDAHHEHKFQPVKTFQHHVARSPPPALQPRSPPASNAKGEHSGRTGPGSKVKEPSSPPQVHIPPASSHVQRFNYTRALFARMEEESKQQTEKEKLAPHRNSPTYGARSPVISPERGIASQHKSVIGSEGGADDSRKKLQLSNDDDELDSENREVTSARRSRVEYKPPVPGRKPEIVNVPGRKPEIVNKPKPAFSEPNLQKAVNSSVSNTPGGLLWKRRQTDIMTDISNTEKYHESQSRGNKSASTSHVEDTNGSTSEMLDSSMFGSSNGSISEDLSITSAYHSKKPHFPSDNIKFNQGRSASTEVLASKPTSHDLDLGSRSLERGQRIVDGLESDRSVDKGGVVMRRSRLIEKGGSAVTNQNKRLSREEIQAAIERADTYLKSTSSVDDGQVNNSKLESMSASDITLDSSSKSQEVTPEQKMSQSDSSITSAANPDSELRSWALYRKQRYARASDPLLEDKVGDVNKLGSISDISVSGFRTASMENLTKSPPEQKSPPNKAFDALSAISQSSVGTRRQLRSQQPPGPVENASVGHTKELLPSSIPSDGVVSASSLELDYNQQKPVITGVTVSSNQDEDVSEVEVGSERSEENAVNYLEIEGLSSTSSESEDEYVDYQAKTDRRIRFSRGPIKVFMTYSTDDYDRRNEDIDPVAASAEYELEKRVERMDVFPVDLHKGPEGLGLSIIGMGVGADAGLEKLGIFIKTLTDGGAAQKSGKMQVNDQIIEVDGKSLVGVTQAYAASVLRNTSGEVKFLIGREKDPSKSEVARLIQQSLELDRRREELKRQEHERLQALHDGFMVPRDEVLEHEHLQKLHSTGSVSSKEDNNVQDLDASSQEEEEMEEAEEEEGKQEEEEMEHTEEISEELQAGEATPLSMPSGVDSEPSPDSSPEEATGKAVVDVFDLQDSSPDSGPEMEPQALFVKLKEAQLRNSVLEAELTKLKGRLLLLENTESQRRQEERRSDDMAARLREVEKALNSARKEINHYQDLMEGSQGQYIALEKKMQGDLTALEKKYHKAKKLIKEYQQREKDFLAEREALIQQQNEKNQQYDALVKSLKDRIFQLESELREAQQAAGLPVLLPHRQEVTVVTETSPPVRSLPPPVRDSGMRPVQDKDSISSESEMSSLSEPPTPAVEDTVTVDPASMFNSMPPTKLLDTSVSKAKAQLAANSPRRPPTKQRSKSQDSEELIEAAIQSKAESGLETWSKHDRTAEYILNLNSDNTVKKSDPSLDISKPAPSDHAPTSISSDQDAFSAGYDNVQAPPTSNTVPAPPPPPVEPTDPNGLSDDWDTPRDRLNSGSESSSTISQRSYDPSQPNFRNKNSEIPGLDSVSTDTSGTVETTGSESSAKKSKGLLPKLPFKFGSSDRDKGGGITLISARGINSDDVPSSEGGITLISKRKLDTGLDFDASAPRPKIGASINSDSSSGYMVGETESARSYQFSGIPGNEDSVSQSGGLNQFGAGQINDWTVENVKHWLIGIEMERFTEIFTERGINGAQLATLDANKLKAMGVTSAKDRDYLKKRLKELRTVLEKEKKQQEKERKQMEKMAKTREKEQKKQSKKK
ncbi:neurabin-1-like isoform X14 [Dreissena polymorpha]|uniref:neurabin-1-like isoform X14 n=1 Tax=Dreissena polymorpha TaxID=45954 RepID=UPI002263C762|nr:neurabin-1-like isoform X14 [Dreissena polymorpha]